MPTTEQIQQFKDHSLDEQYELYIFSNQVVHPPAIYLARSFAKQGPVIVPFLKNKLDKAKDERTTHDIILVFSELAQLKLYEFSSDPDLLRLLEKRANDMRGIWKDDTSKMVFGIQSMARKHSIQGSEDR